MSRAGLSIARQSAFRRGRAAAGACYISGVRLFVILLAPAIGVIAQTSDGPLRSLPYTPVLDVTSMDRSIDPCTDFFQYSCGNWLRKNPIPPDQARWDVYSKLQDENLRFLWGILQQEATASGARRVEERKIGDYFHACIDEAAVDRAGAGPLKPTLAAIAALKSTSGLAALLARLHLSSPDSNALFNFSSAQDFADATRVIAFAAAGGLGLPDRDYYVVDTPKNRQIRGAYKAHVAKMFELLGDPAATASAGAATVFDMETALARASLTRVQKRDPYNLFHKLTRAQLKELTPSFHWDDYLAGMGVATVNSFNVTEPAFYKEMQSLIATRPLADWKTYLRWHAAHSRAPYLSSPFVQANFDFYGRQLRGVPQLQPRWKRCVHYVDRDLGEALGKVFVARTFGPEVKAAALEMTKQVESAMQNDLRSLTWMSDATREQALIKLHGITNKIGYPDRWRDYSTLAISPSDFMGDVERSNEFETRRLLAKIGKPVDRGEWQMTPSTVNAYYDPQMNDINFPAAVLEPPLFDSRSDAAPNYGDTGSTIGHELTHGFDDEGRQFDAKGNLRDWWTRADAERFAARTDCVMKQYAGYTVVDDIKINSRLTLGEDVADLGGTLLAYAAWKSATRGQTLEPKDGLTPDQRFFVGMAQWACGAQRPEAKRVSAITDPHSPNQYRINGVVANLPEFQSSFGCKAGQPMVHRPACRVW
ncbi:MAG: M13 family metallopeptidase [Bryobacterales bacterium]|nr:M13 family metallopeptidase [Bryobacterales bacterium]